MKHMLVSFAVDLENMAHFHASANFAIVRPIIGELCGLWAFTSVEMNIRSILYL